MTLHDIKGTKAVFALQSLKKSMCMQWPYLGSFQNETTLHDGNCTHLIESTKAYCDQCLAKTNTRTATVCSTPAETVYWITELIRFRVCFLSFQWHSVVLLWYSMHLFCLECNQRDWITKQLQKDGNCIPMNRSATQTEANLRELYCLSCCHVVN